MAQWREKRRKRDPQGTVREGGARPRWKIHVARHGRIPWNRGVPTLDYGNNIRQVALEEGLADNAFSTFPGFVPAYIRPLFCRGIGPFRWCGAERRPGGHLSGPTPR